MPPKTHTEDPTMGAIENLGYIKQASLYNCGSPDPLLVIEAAGRAIAPVLISAVSFGCNDIVKLRAGISPWHARGMKALVEGAIPAAQKDQVNGIYKFLVPAEKALFFFFVVDLTTEFLARWQSQLFKLGACDEQPDDCTIIGSDPVGFSPGNNVWATVAYSTQERTGTSCQPIIGLGPIIQPGQNFSITWSITTAPFFADDPPSYVETWLQPRTVVSQQFQPQNTPAPWFGNKITAMYHREGQNTHTAFQSYFFLFRADKPTYVTGGSCQLSVSNLPIYNKGIIPVNCFGQPVPGINYIP